LSKKKGQGQELCDQKNKRRYRIIIRSLKFINLYGWLIVDQPLSDQLSLTIDTEIMVLFVASKWQEWVGIFFSRALQEWA
jgi:hypothetical protein